MTSPCHTDDKKSQAHLKEEQKKTEGSTTQDGFVPIFFVDGTSDRVKLLIPADGVYSTVQAKLEDDQHSNVKNHDKIYCSLNAPPPSTLQYIGIMLINGITLGFHHPLLDERGKMSKTKTVSLKTQSRRIVVLGDAMHAMSPFKGQGANQALSDGPLLVDWLCRKGANLTAALSHFEREMIHRTRNKVIASREAAIYLHSPQVLQTQHDFSGVPKEVVSQFLHELQLRNVTAHLGGQLDKVIYRIIHEMSIAVSPNIMSTRVDDQMETRL